MKLPLLQFMKVDENKFRSLVTFLFYYQGVSRQNTPDEIRAAYLTVDILFKLFFLFFFLLKTIIIIFFFLLLQIFLLQLAKQFHPGQFVIF